MPFTHDRLLRKGDYIHGSFLKPEVVDGYVNSVNPGDRSDVLGRFCLCEGDVDDAVLSASGAVRTWRRVPVGERAMALQRLRESLIALQEQLAVLITRETGKPLWETRQEVAASVRMVDVLLGDGVTMLSPQVVEEVGARMDHVPRGVVALITPFNLPLLVPITHSAMAVLAGNCVVLKPSKFTPATGQAVAELWDRCRLPRGVFNMVQGAGSVTGQRLVLHPGVDQILFTGSFETATTIRRALFDRPELPAIYQCGGKGLALVLEGADLNRTVYEVLVGAFLTAGQRHNSTGRVLVVASLFDRFVRRLGEQAARLRIGYGFDPDVFMGPLVSESRRTRYRRYARSLEGEGHACLNAAGNEHVEGRRGFYVRPAAYEIRWQDGPTVLNEEPPGPILLVYRVSQWEEAAALHNQAFYRSVTSVFARPDDLALAELRDRLRTGSLNVNRSTLGAYLRLPRVGLGRSSNGHAEGLQLLRSLAYPRASLTEHRPFDARRLLPGVHWTGGARRPPSGSTFEAAEETSAGEPSGSGTPSVLRSR
ncbi:MAG: aldehyde dehydrogenase family protein [Deltaproteobacteria bacterium]|nr:aldehyde dehydrogenase family protein [Deltaproteobacteria bacterium]